MNFDNTGEYKKIDPSGVFDGLSLFPEQIKNSWQQAQDADISVIIAKSVVVSGMGGSSNAAKILQGIYEDEIGINFTVHNDYGLPSWVNNETLVVANSYSGNTEETLSCIEEAQKAGARVMGVATGGKIGEMVSTGKIPGAVIDPKDTNPTGFPKSGLGVSFGGLAGALAKANLIPLKESDLFASLDEIKEIRPSWRADEIGQWFQGAFPIYFGARPLIGALNAGRNATCEISRYFTQFYDFPEMNHVLIEALQKPDAAKSSKFFFFESDFYNPRIKKRFEITKDIMTEMGLKFKSHKLEGISKLTQALELAHYCAWVGFYLSIVEGVDPGPEPWILKLKDSLSQPLH